MEDDPFYTQIYHRFSIRYRRFIDKYIMKRGQRWFSTLMFLCLYIVRICQTQSYFVVTYVLSLYIMQVLLKYFTPLGLPDIEDEEEDFDAQLPQQLNASDDRPLLRSMNEITLWEQITMATMIATLTTFFQLFDLPVYWPFLFSYFIMLMLITFRKYWKHMQKYGYSLSDFGKRRDRAYQR